MTDSEDGPLTGSSLTWTLIVHHCPSDCHQHVIGTVGTGTSGSLTPPDHDHPAYLELRLTARDSGGLSGSASVRLDPETVALGFGTSPSGLRLVVNGAAGTTPFSRTVIVGSGNSIEAPSSQTLDGISYAFLSWSDDGSRVHSVVAPTTATTYAATYARNVQAQRA